MHQNCNFSVCLTNKNSHRVVKKFVSSKALLNPMKTFCLLLLCALWLGIAPTNTFGQTTPATKPIRLAVIRTTHGHSGWILGRKGKDDVTLVGIYEPDKALVEQQAKRYNLPASLFYDNLDKMLDAV